MARPRLFFKSFKTDISYRLRLPPGDAACVAFDICPECGQKPCNLQGERKRIASDDRAYESDAVCMACEQVVGTLRLEVNTLFGLREDEAVQSIAGVRIY